MRRLLLLLAVPVVALLAVAPSSWAAESIPDGAWTGSALDAGPRTVDVGRYLLSGTFRRRLDRQVEVTVSASPRGSGPCAIDPTTLAWASTPRAFSVRLTIPCNGTYTLAATAVTTDNSAVLPVESATLDRTVTVAAPAPTVSGVSTQTDGRSITVRWDDMRDEAPDLSGYLVERRIDDGAYDVVATPDATEQAFTDTELPSAGGEATYRVFATRPAPDGTMTSQSSDEAATPFAAAPAGDSGATAPDGTSDAGGAASAPGDAGAPSADQGASGGDRPAGSRSRVTAPSVFSGTFLPPLLRPATETIQSTTPTTTDTGFGESLPYDEQQPGEGPTLPDDAMASIHADGQAGRGMAIPVATALVLAVWAFHLRFLARAARPVD